MRAAIYCRVSKEEQAQEGLSLGAQEDRCRAFAKAKDWTVVQVYVDGGSSGKSLDRPAMQRLLADARHGVWDVVLFWRLDRLSRRQRDILYLLEDVLTPATIGIQSATEPFDTTTPMGKAMLGMLAVFAQLERETIVERTKLGRAQSLKLGRWHGGRVPYGYRHTGRGTLVPDPVTAPVVQTLFAQAATGASPVRLAATLNHDGIPAPQGGAWWDRVIGQLLQNPVYVGRVGRSHPRPGHHPPLVDDMTWARVQAQFQDRAQGPRTARPDFWIDGLLACPQCGEPIRGVYVRPAPRASTSYDDPIRKYRFYYVCARRRRLGKAGCDFRYWHAPAVHAQVLAQIQHWHADPEALEVALQRHYGAPAMAPPDWAAQQAALDARATRWYDAYEDGMIDAATLRRRIDQIRQRQAALEALRPAPVARTPVETLMAHVRRVLTDLMAAWPTIDPDHRQTLLRLLIAGGTITRAGEVQLTLRDLAAAYGVE